MAWRIASPAVTGRAAAWPTSTVEAFYLSTVSSGHVFLPHTGKPTAARSSILRSSSRPAAATGSL